MTGLGLPPETLQFFGISSQNLSKKVCLRSEFIDEGENVMRGHELEVNESACLGVEDGICTKTLIDTMKPATRGKSTALPIGIVEGWEVARSHG